MRKHELLFANFICRFGVADNLLDLAEEVVFPSFLEDGVIRTHGRTRYILHKTKLVRLAKKKDGTPVLALTGHFIKDTILTREQVFKDGSLIDDPASIASSPSAYFVLLLHNHRILYFAETVHAPPISQFESSIQYRMRRKWGEFIDQRYEQLDRSITKKQLRLDSPPPTVSVVPLARRGTMPAQLKKLSEITTIRFKLVQPNDEPSADTALAGIENRFRKVDPRNLEVSATDSSGLALQESRDLVTEALKDPSTEVVVKGKFSSGTKANITNDDLALSEHLEPKPTDKGLRKSMYAALKRLRKEGAVKLPVIKDHVKEKLKKLEGLL